MSPRRESGNEGMNGVALFFCDFLAPHEFDLAQRRTHGHL